MNYDIQPPPRPDHIPPQRIHTAVPNVFAGSGLSLEQHPQQEQTFTQFQLENGQIVNLYEEFDLSPEDEILFTFLTGVGPMGQHRYVLVMVETESGSVVRAGRVFMENEEAQDPEAHFTPSIAGGSEWPMPDVLEDTTVEFTAMTVGPSEKKLVLPAGNSLWLLMPNGQVDIVPLIARDQDGQVHDFSNTHVIQDIGFRSVEVMPDGTIRSVLTITIDTPQGENFQHLELTYDVDPADDATDAMAVSLTRISPGGMRTDVTQGWVAAPGQPRQSFVVSPPLPDRKSRDVTGTGRVFELLNRLRE